jgi:hypothetical protein
MRTQRRCRVKQTDRRSVTGCGFLSFIVLTLMPAPAGWPTSAGAMTGSARAASGAGIARAELPILQSDTSATTQSASTASAADADSMVVFPTVQGTNLEGKEYILPRDFEGRCNLLFVAFKREQQEMVDTWVPAARYLGSTYPELRYYELPTIKHLNAMTRWFINRGMRGGIPDPAARAATITLYIDKEPFRRALSIESEETITILLLDRAGHVLWRSEGPRTDETTRELNEAVRRAMQE